MKNSQLTQYTKALTALTARRDKLQAEVDEINTLLNGTTNGHVRSEQHHPARTRTKAGNSLTLREAITQAVRSRPLTKPEIIAAVQKIGYRFSTSDPAGSVNALLYGKAGKAAFKNHDGRFSAK